MTTASTGASSTTTSTSTDSPIIQYCKEILTSIKESGYNAYAYGSVSFDSGTMNAKGLSNPGTQTAYDSTQEAVSAITTLPTNWGIYGETDLVPAAGCSSASSDGYVLTDCSGFVNHVVSQVASSDLPVKAVSGEGHTYLKAGDYANGDFANASYWTVMKHSPGNALSGVSQGQIMAWSIPYDEAGNPNNDSGHVMVVADTPVPKTVDTSKLPTALQPPSGKSYPLVGDCYLINVYDCSLYPHKSDDRPNGSGMGKGQILLASVALSPTKNMWCVAVNGLESGLVVGSDPNYLETLSSLDFSTTASS